MAVKCLAHFTVGENPFVSGIGTATLGQGERRESMRRLSNLTKKLASGTNKVSGTVDVRYALVQATGTFTCTTVLATQTLTINGQTFTAVTGAPAAEQFDRSGGDNATATSLAAAINASAQTLVKNYVTATASTNVVTVTSQQGGLLGNAITIASGQGTIVASGARMTGGTESFAQFVF